MRRSKDHHLHLKAKATCTPISRSLRCEFDGKLLRCNWVVEEGYCTTQVTRGGIGNNTTNTSAWSGHNFRSWASRIILNRRLESKPHFCRVFLSCFDFSRSSRPFHMCNHNSTSFIYVQIAGGYNCSDFDTAPPPIPYALSAFFSPNNSLLSLCTSKVLRMSVDDDQCHG